jgi:alpha-1,4-digalacturonate transport system permease protein
VIWRDRWLRSANAIYGTFMNIIGVPFDIFQRYAGAQRMAYLFLLPNLLIFGTFTLLPVLLNFYYSFTGGSNPFIQDRPFVGPENYAHLFSCKSFFDPGTCQEDIFWSSIPRTIIYVI